VTCSTASAPCCFGGCTQGTAERSAPPPDPLFPAIGWRLLAARFTSPPGARQMATLLGVRRVFCAALQLEHDFQIVSYSPFASCSSRSRPSSALRRPRQPGTRLVVKAHPWDRACGAGRPSFASCGRVRGGERVTTSTAATDQLLRSAQGWSRSIAVPGCARCSWLPGEDPGPGDLRHPRPEMPGGPWMSSGARPHRRTRGGGSLHRTPWPPPSQIRGVYFREPAERRGGAGRGAATRGEGRTMDYPLDPGQAARTI